MKGHINRVCDVPSNISEADYISRTVLTDILVREAWRIIMTIVIVVDQMSIRPTCVVTVLGNISVIHYQAVVQECPTIWRLYEYVTDPERETILRHRESKQPLALGQGGEGYIASDEWCHNCGDTGHLGDVSPSTVSGAVAPIRATKSLTKSITFIVPTGLPRAPSPTRRAVHAIRLWPLQHPLRALLRRLHRANARPRSARLGKRRSVRRRLGRERPNKRRQARAQQGPISNGATCARAAGTGAGRPGRLVRERSEQAWQQPRWRVAKCERER